MNKTALTAALGASLGTLTAASAVPGEPVAQDWNNGGAAGCYDPNRVSETQQRRLARIGARPCERQREPMPQKSSTTTGTGTWFGQSDNAGIDDGTGLGLTFGVMCEGRKPIIALLADRPSAERLLAGLNGVTVVIQAVKGATRISLPRQPDGDLWADASPAHLTALRATVVITVTTPRWSARFSGRGSSNALAQTTCV